MAAAEERSVGGVGSGGAVGDAAISDSIGEIAKALCESGEPSVTLSLDHLAKATRDGFQATAAALGQIAEALKTVAEAIKDKGQ